MSEAILERISASGHVAASAAQIFDFMSNPEGHVEIDGSGMLQAAPDARPFTGVGDRFTIEMDREPLGDLPLGRYVVCIMVTRFVPGRLIEWGVGPAEGEPLGHVYGWMLEPISATETLVTNYCDWSNVTGQLRSVLTFPVVPPEMLQRSVTNLQQRMAERAAPAG